ncbi:MAG: cation:proton antiporter [Rhodospirillaceae bacterium]|nr:cation:proton antiporter [Rhodospirillaceae bacterium]
MLEQLPALIIVIPLLAAACCAINRSEPFCWFVALLASVLVFVGSCSLLIQVNAEGSISYALGGWEAPAGIEYRVDVLAAYLLTMVSLIAAAVLVYGRLSVRTEISKDNQGWFYAMYLLCACGLMGMVITGDAFNAFVFMEISSLSMYTLIAIGNDKRALLASYQYLIMGTIGATMYIIGVGFLFTVTGTLNLVDMSARLQPLLGSAPVMAGMAFIVVGLSLKIALFPLHFWLPNAYSYAPSVTTILVAATATKVSIYLLLRYLFSVFGLSFGLQYDPLALIIMTLSVVAIFVGSLNAIFEDNIKRMLAFSSVAQIGYITLGVSLFNFNGLVSSLVHIFNHALIKASLFMLLGGIALQVGKVSLRELGGIGRKMPITMAAFSIGGLSLLGVPGTVGFITKWYLLRGAMDNEWWWLVILVLLSSLLVLIYIGKIIEVAYFRETSATCMNLKDPPLSMLSVSVLFAFLCVYFGFDTTATVGIATQAVESLIVAP